MEVDLIVLAARELWHMLPEGHGATLTLDGSQVSLLSNRNGSDELVFYFRHHRYELGTVVAISRRQGGRRIDCNDKLNIADPDFFEKAMDLVKEFVA